MRPRCNKAAALLAGAFLLAAVFGGCSSRSAARLNRPMAPEAYQRRIVLVVETAGFRPVAGAEVTIETQEPTQLVSPAGGKGRTDGRGALTLVFDPPADYDKSAWAGGDIIVDYPVKAKLLIKGPGRSTAERYLDDRETFARYDDPLYQGLNRDPEPGLTYYTVVVP